MKIQTWRILLLLVFVAMVLFGSAVIADNDISEWNAGDGKPDSEVDGTEGFGVDIGLNKQQGDASGEASTLEGVIDVDTYLNIRSGPWENIVGGFRTGEKIKIVSKDGDWFKIVNGNSYAYVHAYYVDAPGFPSHQGVEPPILGSNESPYGDKYSAAGAGGSGGVALLGYLQQAGLTGEELKMAWAIGMAESGGAPDAYNGDSSTGDMSYGLFQINMLGDLGPARMEQYGLSCYEDLFDPMTNIRVMIQMSANCSDWSPWSTYNRGNHEEFLSQFPPQ